MSVDVLITCDGEHCDRDGVPMPRHYKRQTEASQMKGSFWMSDSGYHYCPRCIKAHLDKAKGGAE
jgi:hypothetical protein